MTDRPIALVGLRGTGKTTVGRLLAERLGLPFVDTDDDVERVAGKSIARIFSDDGEAHFRDLEAKVIAELLKGPPTVLATGGGSVLRDSTRRLLADRARVIWLTATPETLLARLATDPTTTSRRPRLTGFGPREEIERLCREREPLYREVASLVMPTDNVTTADLVNSLVPPSRVS